VVTYADILNYSLQSNAGLTYSDSAPAQMAASTRVALQEARRMVAMIGALYQVLLPKLLAFVCCLSAWLPFTVLTLEDNSAALS
jgi:hypothetical protein